MTEITHRKVSPLLGLKFSPRVPEHIWLALAPSAYLYYWKTLTFVREFNWSQNPPGWLKISLTLSNQTDRCDNRLLADLGEIRSGVSRLLDYRVSQKKVSFWNFRIGNAYGKFGPFWTMSDNFGPFLHFGLFWTIWTILDRFGPFWTVWTILDRLDHFGPF